jgi:hypothetical protein
MGFTNNNGNPSSPEMTEMKTARMGMALSTRAPDTAFESSSRRLLRYME